MDCSAWLGWICWLVTFGLLAVRKEGWSIVSAIVGIACSLSAFSDIEFLAQGVKVPVVSLGVGFYLWLSSQVSLGVEGIYGVYRARITTLERGKRFGYSGRIKN